MTKVRIAVADDEPDMREYFQKILPRLGFEVVAVAENGRELVELCRTHHPDVVITDIKMPQLDGIEAAKAICENEPIPVVLVSAHHQPELIERAGADHAMAYLVKPVKQADLEPAIAIARSRFAELMRLQQETADLRQALADRIILEQAKRAIMKKAGVGEQAAFARLHSISRRENQKLVAVAEAILLANDAFQPASPKDSNLADGHSEA